MTRELKLAFHYVRKYWWRYILGLAALFLVDQVNANVPLLSGELTDGLTAGTLDMGGVWGIAIRLLGMGAAINIGRFLWRFFLFGSARMTERDLRGRLFSHLENMSMSWYNEHKTGDLMARFTNDLGAIRGLLGGTMVTTFDATVMLILVLMNMIRFVSIKLTLVAVIPLIVIIFGNIWFGKQMHRRFLARQESQTGMAVCLMSTDCQRSVKK